MNETPTHPVRLDATRDPDTSRWLWLVKWLLLIPHAVVLIFLWISLIALSVVSFWAILFTGRYPRRIFDFNVGVLRWTWRVTYYGYGALGTDRYPPFTLHDVPDYPARLDVAYPGQLSRGLVLVKWWLLAIPHYLVVAILVGGGQRGWHDGQWQAGGFGFLGLLVLVAGFLLLFTGRYPESLFSLVIGLNRWVFRVAGYAALMTDDYPPFRLDQGGRDPATPPSETPHPPALRHGSVHWGVGRVLVVALGSLLALGALTLGGAATTLGLVGAAARDDDGYLTSPSQHLTSDTYAITTESLRLEDRGPGTFVPESLLGKARLRATAPEGGDLFLGIAPTDQVEAYLSDVEYDVRTDVGDHRPGHEVRTHAGGAPETPPTSQSFWTAQTSGPGTQTLDWDVESGDWTVVLMNADGSRTIDADVTIGATLPGLGKVVAVLIGIAVAGLAIGALLIVLALMVGRRPDPEPDQRGIRAQ